jgi:DNA-directed RNA polymerase omega subunit
MNRYEAVIVASKEARRINDAMTKEQKEVSEKPIVSALRRLADDKLEVEKPRQKKG